MQVIKKVFKIYCGWVALIYVLTTLPIGQATAQTIKRLKVNDTLPDIEIANLVHERAEPLRTKTMYKDGLLIVNFWATWCVPCVQEMTFLGAEVKKYKGRLHVINIGYEQSTVVKGFLKLHPEIANSGLEITSDDKIWIKMFFHQALPHNIWVDNKGIIKSITGGDEITDINIQKLLNAQPTKMYQKNEVHFDPFKPMPVPDSLIEYRSIFNRYLPGVKLSGSVIDSHGWGRPYMKRFFEYNSTITGLFWDAYQMSGDYNYRNVSDFIEVRTSDSSKYFLPGRDAKTGEKLANYGEVSQSDWIRENTYSYELRTPKALPDSVFFNKVVKELEFNLNVKTWKELRWKNCNIVTIKNADRIKSNNPSAQAGIISDGNKIIVTNASMDLLLRWLSEKLRTEFRNSLIPYINKTGIHDLISFTIDIGDGLENKSREDIEKLMSRQLGFHFKKQEQLYPILIIKDL